MDQEPTHVTRGQLLEALRVLGIGDPDTVAGVEMLPGHVVLTRYRLDGRGVRFMAGRDAAKVVTAIAVRDEPVAGE